MKKKKFKSYVHGYPFKKYYQFKVSLRDVKPHVWRRIQVPQSYTFWDLHVSITDCMPLLDYHLHEFIVRNPRTGNMDHIGIGDDEGFEVDYKFYEDVDRKLSTYFSGKNTSAEYLYDFGDGWEYDVLNEGLFNREECVDYPRCVAGENACPPEDVGGTGGYGMFLKVISRPNHAQREEQLRWAEYLTGRYPFDPHHFDVNEVRFDDPEKRWFVSNGEMDVTPDMRLYDWGEKDAENI